MACFNTWCRIGKPTSIARHQEPPYCAVAEIYYLNYIKTEHNDLDFVERYRGLGQRSGYSDCLRAGRAGDRIPWVRDFQNPPYRPCGPPSELYNGYRVILGGSAAEGWR